MKAIIVEDVLEHYQTLALKLKAVCPTINVMAHAQTCEQAVELIVNLSPDIVFLDIELPDGLGFTILPEIAPLRPAIIFVTGFEEHMQRAFEFSAIDFLLKPVNPDKLKEAVERAEERNNIHFKAEQYEIFRQSSQKEILPSRIALSNPEMIIFKDLNEIVYLEAKQAKTAFHFKDYFIEVNRGLIEFEQMFINYHFLKRCSKSFIVNFNEVRHFVRADMSFYMSNGHQVYIGDHYKQEVFNQLRNICEKEQTRIELSDQKLIAFPYLKDILFLNSDGAFTRFYIKGYRRFFTVAVNLGRYDNLPGFKRIHNSYTVNINEVDRFNRSQTMAVLKDGEQIPVSEKYKSDLLNLLNDRTMDMGG